MALFIRQNDNRTELQERIAAELQERAKQKAAKADLPDGVSDSQFIKNTNKTTHFGWVWIIVAVILLGFIIWLTIRTTKS